MKAAAVLIALGLIVPGNSQQTPDQCLAEVTLYVSKRQVELRPLTSETAAKLSAERAAMIKACAAKFDVRTVPEKDLAALAEVYTAAGLLDQATAALARAKASSGLTETQRAAVLLQTVRVSLREPKGDERNARIETVIDELDALPDAVAFDQKFSAHVQMNGYYRADDIDAGIIRHSTWLIEKGKTLTPALRLKYGPSILSGYVNMAEAWAGQGMNDRAIALLERAPVEWADLPNVGARVESTLARYRLVGTKAAPITAPHWLNASPGTGDLPMTGHVTLLEFTAHWCGPCKESYPGINRLRERFGARGFRVVLATQLYGYFQAERPLDAATEIDRDRTYFAEHHLDVPIAISERVDPNDAAYKVGGIPQIHLIDRQGRIRLIMVGYDDANEPRLATMIEALLKER